ncbi:MAG: hypothetical protein ACE5GZ_07395, partial [Gammaproteobacteria bacterium]
VRRFASEVKEGDVFLLRTGISTVTAIGIVSGEYQYLNQFDDVNGWDLQHARRVRWFKLPQDHVFDKRVFGANPSRCSRSHIKEVMDFTHRFINSPPADWQQAPLPELPKEEEPLAELPESLRDVVAKADDVIPILWNQYPSEDELIAHFVVPFLEALGWKTEQIAVQWQNIDVAVFRKLPRSPENCEFIIEAKSLGSGVEGALAQAIKYVKKLAVSLDVIVTDGIRYRMYSCQDDFNSIAYANLIRLKSSATDLFNRMKRP